MSMWYYQQPKGEAGPVSFTRLARLVVDGDLNERSVVRRDTSRDWQPISTVVGLRKTCQILMGEREYSAPMKANVESTIMVMEDAERKRLREMDRAYQRAMNARAKPEDEPALTRRDALLVWAPLGILAGSVAAAVIYQMAADPWESRTYRRDKDGDG